MNRKLRINWQTIKVTTVVLLLASISVIKLQAQTPKMEPTETKEIVKGIYSIKDSFVNLFILQDGDGYIVVDAGTNIGAITQELEKLKINPDKVTALFLTHSHPDHVAAVALFKKATIYLSNTELPAVASEKPLYLTLNKTEYKNKYVLLNDQQVVRTKSLSVKAIQTPGHTPGSISYLVNDKYLFVGDAFSLVNGKVAKPNEGYTKDMKSAIASFDKINKLPKAEYIFTAHTGYSADYKNAVSTELK